MNSEMLLLGAGASVEAKVPNALDMTDEIIKRFNADTRLSEEAKVLRFVNEQLVAQAIKSDPLITRIDVEALYNAILSLSERPTLEISAFIETWHPEVLKIRDAKKVFDNIMFRMEMMAGELTLIKDKGKVDYLKPILNLVRSQTRLFIATLNYDNAIELLSRENGIACDTGIENWNDKGVFSYTGDGIQLIKLHGSNYWLWTKDTVTSDSRLPHRQIRAKSHFEEKLPMIVQVETPMIIFGHRNKLTAEGPFLDLLKEFDEQLQKTDILTVIGYSFRDSHINFYISKFLNQYGGKIIVVGPGFQTSTVKYVQDLREFKTTRPTQIDVIEKYAGEALQILYPH